MGWAAMLKSGDQMSPLMLRRMPTFCSFLVIVIIFGAWAAALGHVMNDLFLNCTEANGCVSCTVSLEDVDGAKCSPLAATSLGVRAGCATYNIDNNFTLVQDIVQSIDFRVKYDWELPRALKKSMTAHGKILNALRSNSNGQMIDPDADAV